MNSLNKIMTQEERELLLKDLSARLLYGVICKVEFKDSEGWKIQNMLLEGVFINECYFTTNTGSIYSKEFKPYLRPMSSMTEEEKIESLNFAWGDNYGRLASYNENIPKYIDWLNKKMFAYRTIDGKDMFELGLAFEAPKDMYKIN